MKTFLLRQAVICLLLLSSFNVSLAQCDITLTPVNLDYPTCGGTDGSFQVQVSGITAPYQYWLYKEDIAGEVLVENGTLIAGTLTWIGLGGGNYRVEVSKNGECLTSTTIISFPAQELILTPVNINSASCGGTDGSFQVQVSGMLAPYQYWLYKDVNGSDVLQENGTLIAGTPTFVGLTGGDYRLDISKGGTCSGSVRVIVPVDELTMTPANINSASCGANDGSFQVQVSGMLAPYQYWLYKDVNGSDVLQENGTLIAGNPTFVFLTGGDYRVDIAKGGTCSGSVSVTVPVDELTMTPANINSASCGANDGSFQVQVSGMLAPYQYWLYKDVNGSDVLQENGTLIAGNPTFVFLTGGDYRVDIAKGGTCSGSVSVTVPVDELILTPANIRSATCGANDGSFQVQVSGIVAPYQYRLDKIVNGSPELQENGTLIAGTPTFVFLTGGEYQVTITKGGTCTSSVNITVPQEQLVLTTASLQQPSCGGSNGSFSVLATGITLPYQFILYKKVNGNWVIQTNGTQLAGNPTFVGLSEGDYRLEISKGGTCSRSIDLYLYCEAIGKVGCGQGYWKTNLQAWTTTNYSPLNTLESVFNVPDQFELDNTTLLEILLSSSTPGGVKGAAITLLRAATAAILNAYHPQVNYPMTQAQIISAVNSALASGNKNTMNSLANTLEKQNNKACPLDAVVSTIKGRAVPVAQEEATEDGLIVSVYPNPATGPFNLKFQTRSAEKIRVRVTDVLGRTIEIKENVPPGRLLSLGNNYRKGIYFIEVQQGMKQHTLKVIRS